MPVSGGVNDADLRACGDVGAVHQPHRDAVRGVVFKLAALDVACMKNVLMVTVRLSLI
jgi:hypothetical protein